MTCDDSREIASARLDGEATPEETGDLERHLARCVDCRRWDDALRADRARLRLWPDETPAERRRVPSTRIWLAAASILLALAAGFAVGRFTAERGSSVGIPGAVSVDGSLETPATRLVFVEERRVVYPARNEVHSEAVLRQERRTR